MCVFRRLFLDCSFQSVVGACGLGSRFWDLNLTALAFGFSLRAQQEHAGISLQVLLTPFRISVQAIVSLPLKKECLSDLSREIWPTSAVRQKKITGVVSQQDMQ